MAGVQNLNKVLRALKKLEEKYGVPGQSKTQAVVVGYNSAYAVYVHENLEPAHGADYNAKHQGKAKRDTAGKFIEGRHNKGKFKKRGPKQQAKFLEQPAREMQDDLRLLIEKSMANGRPLIKALLIAGVRLQRESQKLVPVDTGNLKGSAFTELE